MIVYCVPEFDINAWLIPMDIIIGLGILIVLVSQTVADGEGETAVTLPHKLVATKLNPFDYAFHRSTFGADMRVNFGLCPNTDHFTLKSIHHARCIYTSTGVSSDDVTRI